MAGQIIRLFLPTYRRSQVTHQILSLVSFKYSAVLRRSAAGPHSLVWRFLKNGVEEILFKILEIMIFFFFDHPILLLLFLVFQSRAALSVLAYTYYQMQDFVNASDCYEQLSSLFPDVEEYRLYYAQSLYKACLFQEAMKVACQIDQPQYAGQVRKDITLYQLRVKHKYLPDTMITVTSL